MNKIKGYRIMMGYTQKELSELLGVSEGTYRRKEKGQNQFKSEEMFKIINIAKEKKVDVKASDFF